MFSLHDPWVENKMIYDSFILILLADFVQVIVRTICIGLLLFTPPQLNSIEHNIGFLRPKYPPANRRFLGGKKWAKKSNAGLGHILWPRDQAITPILLEV